MSNAHAQYASLKYPSSQRLGFLLYFAYMAIIGVLAVFLKNREFRRMQ
jgi:hypothetical protein